MLMLGTTTVAPPRPQPLGSDPHRITSARLWPASKAPFDKGISRHGQPVRAGGLAAGAGCTAAACEPGGTRRNLLLSMQAAVLLGLQHSWWDSCAQAADLADLEKDAFEAYSDRKFQETSNLLTQILQQEPNNPRWYEMRAQVLVDGKNFPDALADFNKALSLSTGADLVAQARLKSGRALAYEGISDWKAALADYCEALDLALRAGESPDPYIINSRGNCYNSLGMWAEARSEYLTSSQLFQQAKGFRGRNGSTTPRLDGAIFSASNAALMLAQLGDTDGAVNEMVRIARRAPGSADMRAALAALYYSRGQQARAEDEWDFACNKINVGCSKYQDRDWLQRIRRWPPVMVDKMQDFVQLKKAEL